MYKSLAELKDSVLSENRVRRCIVVGADNFHALEAVIDAQNQNLIEPILIGPRDKIKSQLINLNNTVDNFEVINCIEKKRTAEIAVDLIHENKGDFILKGNIETKNLLQPILNKKNGLNKRGFITHFGLMQLKNYHKLLVMSDSAVIPYPNLDEKKKIVSLCIETMIKLGIEKPVVGALCAVEVVNSKMIETIHAAELESLSKKGEFGEGVVIGPISFDLATQIEAAKIKDYTSPYAGNVDMLLVPQMVTGNVMSKIWNIDPENILSGCLIGADIPIALTSRSASTKEKFYSLVLCCALS